MVLNSSGEKLLVLLLLLLLCATARWELVRSLLRILAAEGVRGSSARGKRPRREGGRGKSVVVVAAVAVVVVVGALVVIGGGGGGAAGAAVVAVDVAAVLGLAAGAGCVLSVPEEYAESVGGTGKPKVGFRSKWWSSTGRMCLRRCEMRRLKPVLWV